MKKLFTLFLCLVMLCTLTMPALALEMPSDDILISPAPDDYWDDPSFNWTAEAEWEALCEEQPERTALFLSELDDWFPAEYPWYDSFDECAEVYGGEEAAYLMLFGVWNMDYELAILRDEDIIAHGGVPGQLNVMLNGQYVKFPDAAPETVNGRTMVPFRAILEALGAEVTYNSSDDIRCTANGFQYTFAIGSETVTVRPTADNAADVPMPEDIVMDCAPYAKDGRTYIPLRFISEALGYDVRWDSYYEAAVVTDAAALTEEIDKDFTVLNKLWSQQAADAQNHQSVGNVIADLTLFNSLDGNQTMQLTMNSDLLVSQSALSGKVEYDFAPLWDIYEEYIAVPLSEDDSYAQQAALLKLLLAGAIDLRMDLENGTAYCCIPALMPSAWFNLPLEELDMGELTGAAEQVSSVGGLIVSACLSGYGDPACCWDDALETAAQIAGLVGDDHFTRDESAYVFTMDLDGLAALLEESDSYYYELPKDFSLTLTIQDDGAMELALTYRDREQLVSVQGKADAEDASITMELHMKNQFKLTVTAKQTTVPTDKAPQTTPPAGALLLDLQYLEGLGL